MALLDQLAARRAAFHFVERFDAGSPTLGPRELIAKAARWLYPGPWDARLPDVLPMWRGSYLPHERAARLFGVAEVWTVVIGCRDAKQRRGLVEAIRRSPPLGLIKLEAAADWAPSRASLPIGGFIVPNGVIEFAARRHIDRLTGLDIIGIDEEESAMLSGLDQWGKVDGEDPLAFQLLKTLAKRVGRSMRSASAADGFPDLVDQSFELYGLGAVSLSGAIAGVAFETLMRAALDSAGQAWAANVEAQGGRVQLNDVVAKVASAGAWDGARLHHYRELRNDFAHRLGDDADHTRDPEELRAELGRLLRWLDRQSIDDQGHAALADVPPEPTLDHQQLYDLAIAAGEAAADRTEPILIRVQTDEFEAFGTSWVIVQDSRLSFSRWLLDQGHGSPDDRGVRLAAPRRGLERGLAWAQACAAEFNRHEIVAFDGGVPD